MKEATISIILDTHKGIPKKNGKYSVKIRVTYQRKQKYFTCDCDLTPEQFNKVMYTSRLNRNEQEVYDHIVKQKLKITEIVNGMVTFSWDQLKDSLGMREKNVSSSQSPVYNLYDILIQKNENEGRIGNANLLRSSQTALKLYQPNLQFHEITAEFLQKFEQWFLNQVIHKKEANQKRRSITTLGIYLRELRSVYNTAISREYKLADQDLYPFNNKSNPNGYIIPKGKNIKKALSIKQIRQVMEYSLVKGSPADRSRDFWYFSYLNNGINHKDISLLKYKDISQRQIHFDRAKTYRKNRDKNRTIISALLDESQKIIDKWGNADKSPDNYVFPILLKNISPRRMKEIQTNHLRTINKHNKKLAEKLKLEVPLTTMTARHSFASVMVENGVDLAIIKELMGHASITTTEIYVRPFNSITRRKTAKLLIAS